MGDNFNAESGQHHELENVKVDVYRDGNLISSTEVPLLNLHLTGLEHKTLILGSCTKVPLPLKNKPSDWDLVYADDNKRELILDTENLLKYETDLSGNESCLEVRHPRGNCNTEKPKQDLGNFNVTKKVIR